MPNQAKTVRAARKLLKLFEASRQPLKPVSGWVRIAQVIVKGK